uniref:Uncharacterized protein n=1 Tax=Geospiza parvula TaxID=87175 RepID=A0A8C3NGF8_GEOPR
MNSNSNNINNKSIQKERIIYRQKCSLQSLTGLKPFFLETRVPSSHPLVMTQDGINNLGGFGLIHWAQEPRTPGLKPSCRLSFPQRWDYRHVPLMNFLYRQSDKTRVIVLN